MLRTLFASTLLLLALVAAGCAGSSRDDFADQVRASRDRTDAALENMARSQSVDELLERLRTAADEARGAADDLDQVDPPDELEDEADRLSSAFRALADEVEATAEALADVDFESPIEGLDFRNWNSVQDALAELRNQGIDVPPLERR